MIQTNFFKYDSGVYSIFMDNEWTETTKDDLGKNIGEIITSLVTQQYTKEQILEIESDSNHVNFQTYWNLAIEKRDLVNDDYNNFEEQLINSNLQ